MPTKSVLLLLEASMQATSLVIAATTSMCRDDIVLFHMNSIKGLVKHLKELVECPELSMPVKKSSLRILMVILRNLSVNTLLKLKVGDGQEIAYHLSIHEACTECIDALLNLNSSWSLLPDGYSVFEPLPGVEDLLCSWIQRTLPSREMQQVEAAREEVLEEAQQTLLAEIPSTVDRSLHSKAHLLMIITICMRIASSSSVVETLREVAMKVIGTVDIAQLVNSYTDLLRLSERLTNENKKLKELTFRVDAASLNY
jgi:hypothetical protein